MLGKRKRVVPRATKRQHEAENKEEERDREDLNNLLRQHFEATFEPLPAALGRQTVDTEATANVDDTESEVSEWSGLSESSKDTFSTVEVVDHALVENGNIDRNNRVRQRAFMVRPLRLSRW